MNRFTRKCGFPFFVSALALAMGLVACGDDSSSGSDDSSLTPVESEIDLAGGKKVTCDEKMEGVVAVTADAGYLKCEDGRWVKISEDEALSADKIIGLTEDKSSSSKKVSSSSSVIPGTDPEPQGGSSSSVIPSGSEGSSSSSGKSSSSAAKGSSSSHGGNTSSSVIPGTDPEPQGGSSSSVILSGSDGSSSSNGQSSSSAEKVSSSSKAEDPSTLYRCDADGKLYENPENCPSHSDGITSSDTPASSADAIPGTDPESSSDTPVEEVDEPAEVMPSGYYKTNCPEGLDCKDAATTEYLNQEMLAAGKYGEILDTRDDQVYKTITIGKGDKAQTWMAQNLNYAYKGVKYNYEDFYTSDSTSWCYDNKVSNCDKYGRLYTWAAAMDSAGIVDKSGAGKGCGFGVNCAAATSATRVRGVCPSGWHLPSNAEWNTLFENVGGTVTAGKMLKANTDLWDNNTGADEYGFSVLPAGDRNYDGTYYYMREHVYFWSSTANEDNGDKAWSQFFYYKYDYVSQNGDAKYRGSSVRCLKDIPDQGGTDLESSSSKYRCDADGKWYDDPEECPGHSDGITSSDSPGADSESSSPKYKCDADGKWYDDPEECPGHSDGITSSETSSSDSESSSPHNASWAYLDQNKTYDIFMDTRDGQVYKTITIGEGNKAQTWMAENLNYSVEGQSWCGGGTPETQNEGDCSLYGRLYTWKAAVEACPEGWFLPSKAAWEALYTAVGGEAVAGKNLKANADLWVENTGSNSSGFSAIPAGRRDPTTDGYDDLGKFANFWSSTLEEEYPWYQYFGYTYDDAGQFKAIYVNDGFSVRCLKGSSFQGTDGKLVWQDLNPDKGYGEFIDSRDNQVYKTIKICNEKNENCQTWMAENLNYVPENVSDMWEGAWIGCYGQGLSIYTPDVVSSNCAMYGRLYSWDVAMDKAECGYGTSCGTELNPATPVRGICPEGWHLPSHHEFETLINNVGGLDTAGKSLKVVPFGTNSSGFSAVHAGVLNYGRFEEDLYFSSFWSSSEENEKSVYSLYMQGVLQGPHSSQAKFSGFLKNDATSVRCLKDTK